MLTPAKAAKITQLLLEGHKPEAIARKMSRGSQRHYRRWMAWIYRAVAQDPAYQAAMVEISRGILIQSLPEASAALTTRARRGRPDAIKLSFEASGFHNSRVKHDHTGEVQISFHNVPRPERVDPAGPGKTPVDGPAELLDVPDADVVEE